MRRDYRRFLPFLLSALVLGNAGVAAGADENGLIVAEDMLIDEALTGILPTDDKKPVLMFPIGGTAERGPCVLAQIQLF